MKAIKILTFVIIGILIIGIGVGTYIYFYTDTFKTNKEIFYKYASEEQLSKIIDFDSIKQLVSKLKSQNSEQNMEAIINVSEGDKNIINNASISLDGKTNPSENKSEITLAFGNDNKKDVVEISGIYDKDKYGILFTGITNKYIALENKNSNEFWKNIGINSSDMEKLDLTNNDIDIEQKLEELKSTWTEFFTKIAEQTPKEKYSNLGKTQIQLNGQSVEVKAYEVKLNKAEMQPIYNSLDSKALSAEDINILTTDSINTNKQVDFSQVIYVYEEKVVKTEITMNETDDDNTKQQTYQITKTFGKEENNLTIQINEKAYGTETMEALFDISNKEDSNYKMNFGITSEEVKITADINMQFTFNTNPKMTDLTDKNTIMINDKSNEELQQFLGIVVAKMQEKEGVEDTILGVLMEMSGSLFNESEATAENASAEEKEQLSQESEQVAEMTNSTNN